MARRLLAVIVPAILILAPVAEAQTTVKVPNVVGKRLGDARDILQNRAWAWRSRSAPHRSRRAA
jgi:beta-lactam-binding protein with PASTA domain